MNSQKYRIAHQYANVTEAINEREGQASVQPSVCGRFMPATSKTA